MGSLASRQDYQSRPACPGAVLRIRRLAARTLVFEQSRDLFIIYTDRKLLTPATIARLETQILLPTERTEIHSDLHYQSTETPKLPGA